MKTRNQIRKKPEIIQIQSEKSVSQHLNSDDSSCSDVSNSSGYQESNSQPLLNLIPKEDTKRKNGLRGIKSLLQLERSDTANSQQALQQYQRAPVLNLLRPIKQQQVTSIKEQIKEQQDNQDYSDEVSLEPLPLEQVISDNDIQEMGQPKKKPKLMDELQAELNLPIENYKVTEQGQARREKRKKQNKKRNYMIDKKLKEFKTGKRKDNISNQVFNAINDFFA